jgi:hypothetical protein
MEVADAYRQHMLKGKGEGSILMELQGTHYLTVQKETVVEAP